MKRFNPNRNFFLFLIFTFVILLLFTPIGIDIASARPGGGSGFSSGGSGGGSGDGLIQLVFYIIMQLPPQISIPLIIIIIIGKIIIDKKKKKSGNFVTSAPTLQARQNINSQIENSINSIKAYDPNFSKTLFLDFASSIFTKYYALYAKTEFKNLTPFLEDFEIKESNKIIGRQEINEIVIGNIFISEIQVLQDIIGIAVDIDANFTVKINNKSTRYIVTERWYFNRNIKIQSHEPGKMQKLACPNCGAPADFTDAGQCNHCNTFIEKGEHQWFVKTHKVLNQQVFKTSGLAHYEPEEGTNYPTIKQTSLHNNSISFAQNHNIDYNQWESKFRDEVISNYFFNIYEAWSANNLLTIRGLISDRLYDSFMFWIENYKREGLVNKLENIEINDIQFARIETDKFYESVTVRIFAEGLDYVEDKNGKVKGGSKRRPRAFSEYWTFVRRAGVERDGFDIKTCPNCGAPADKMGQAGVCEYCGTKVSTGEFSWVLSLIVQDEVYAG